VDVLLEVPMRRCLMLAFAVLAFSVAPSAWAQTTTGVIRGVVTDESGAVLPGVTVTLKGSATAARRRRRPTKRGKRDARKGHLGR
jgi:hypothetical protein